MGQKIDDYIEKRLIEQRSWYEKKASINKIQFFRFQKTIIVLGAFIPVLVVFSPTIDWLAGAGKGYEITGIMSAVISAVISILAGFDKLNQPQTFWYNYRTNEEILKKEEYYFRFRVGPYREVGDKEAEKLLVERVESIISADIARFVQTQKQEANVTDEDEDGDKDDDGIPDRVESLIGSLQVSKENIDLKSALDTDKTEDEKPS